MAPIRTYTSDWRKRYSNETEQIDPFRKYFFLCEGENTERYYFEKLIDSKKELNISSNVYLEFLEKTENDKGKSAPKCLIELADKFIKDNKENFDAKFDKIVLVFDLDIYENNQSAFNSVVSDAREKGYLLALTNPSFELFLLLHKENSLSQIIKPVESEIISNEWIERDDGSKKRYVNNLFFETFGFNPKSSKKVKSLVLSLNTAINQEKHINQNIDCSHNTITSNVGKIIENIIANK